MPLVVYPGRVPSRKSANPSHVYAYTSADGIKRFGMLDSREGGKLRLKHIVTVGDGRGLLTDVAVDVMEDSAERTKAVERVTAAGRVVVGDCDRRFEQDGAKGVAVKNPDGQIVDYTSVTIKGYASTFDNTDRQGDNVKRGAFTDTIRPFMTNPVMLIDHRNSVEYIAGKYTVVREDNTGLYIEGAVSDAPEMRAIRFRLMEGSLRTLSIGGMWFFGQDGRTIEKVHLFEISLVAVPANPEAIISARSIGEDKVRELILTA